MSQGTSPPDPAVLRAKEALTTYCFLTTNTLKVEHLQDKYDPVDKQRIEDKICWIGAWLHRIGTGRETGTVADIDAKQKELEDLVKPVMMRAMGRRAWCFW